MKRTFIAILTILTIGCAQHTDDTEQIDTGVYECPTSEPCECDTDAATLEDSATTVDTGTGESIDSETGLDTSTKPMDCEDEVDELTRELGVLEAQVTQLELQVSQFEACKAELYEQIHQDDHWVWAEGSACGDLRNTGE